jgi:acetoin utilization deacetylase AcuC-like enzyme
LSISIFFKLAYIQEEKYNEGGCFGILEGGYNHEVLGGNVLALIQGMARG